MLYACQVSVVLTQYKTDDVGYCCFSDSYLQKALHWTPMADDSNGQRQFRPVSNGQWWTFDVTWSQQKSTLAYTLNLELMYRSTIPDVQIY